MDTIVVNGELFVGIFRLPLNLFDFLLFIMNPERDQHTGYLSLHLFEIARLIIEEDMRSDSFKDAAFIESVQQKKFGCTHAEAF